MKDTVASRVRVVVAFMTFMTATAFIVTSTSAATPQSAQSDLSYVNSRGESVFLTKLAPDADSSVVLPNQSDNRRIAVFATSDRENPVLLGDEIIVKFDGPTWSIPETALAAGITNGRPLDRERTTWLCTAESPEGVLRASRMLAGKPGIRWALPDFTVVFELHGRPSDPYYQKQWALFPDGSVSRGPINAEQAWDVTTGDPRVVVAVIDTGVDVLHPDLLTQGRFAAGFNAVENNGDPWPGPLAGNAHGTHCAGIIGALHNDQGVAGLCPGCGLMGARFLDGLPGDKVIAQLSNAAGALRHAADNGSWVISNSWGIYNANKPQVDMQPLYDAARYAATHGGPDGAGALVIFSSGNQMGYDEQTDKTFALKIAPDDMAALPEVLAVGATDPSDTRQIYSQYGPELDLVAPGGALSPSNPQMVTLDTSGEIDGKGNGANKGDGSHYVSAALLESRKTGQPETDATGQVTEYFNGTSSAVPVVAGIAALVWSADLLDGKADLTAADVRRILIETADKTGPAAYVDGRNDEYGFGRVNAGRAVLAVMNGIESGDDDRVEHDPADVIVVTDAGSDATRDSAWPGEDAAAPGDATVPDYGHDSRADPGIRPDAIIIDLPGGNGDVSSSGCSAAGPTTAGSAMGSLSAAVFALFLVIVCRVRRSIRPPRNVRS